MVLCPNFERIRVDPILYPILGRIVLEPKKNRQIGNPNARFFSADSYRPYVRHWHHDECDVLIIIYLLKNLLLCMSNELHYITYCWLKKRS